MGLLDRIKGEIERRRQMRQLAESAAEKLELAEEKTKAKKLIEKAKKAGVDMTEFEALAYVREHAEKKQQARPFKFADNIAKFAEGYTRAFEGMNAAFGSSLIGPEPMKRSGRRKKKRKRTRRESEPAPDFPDFTKLL